METSSIQIYLSQFGKILGDPVGIMALVAMLGLAMLVVVTRSGKWFALMLGMFAICCSMPASKYISQAPFIAPLQFFRNWSRPITFVSLIILLACMIRFERGVRLRLLPKSFWMFVAFQVFGCLRLILIPNLADRGLGALVIVIMMVGVAVLTLAPGIQSLRDANLAVWAVAGCGLCFMGSTLLQYGFGGRQSVEWGGRLFGIAANPQYASYLMAFTLPSMCYLLIRRKQGLWVTFNLVLFSLAIPATALMLIWTGSRGGVLCCLVGLIVFFHRRLGRFVLAGAVCVAVGLFLSQYLGDAFGIINRFFNEGNTRAAVWAQMIDSILKNPIFGYISNSTNVYSGATVGEGSFLMSLSMFGVVGSLPLFLGFGMFGWELLQLYSMRKVIPELADLVDLSLAFWCSAIISGIFESYLISYFTNVMFIIYTFFVLQGFLVDYGRQAAAERRLGVQLTEYDLMYPQYAA